MKFTRDWLSDHLKDFDWEAVLDRLPQIGLEVEHLQAPLALEGFALAQVVEVRPHPNADKLRIARVRLAGGDYDKQIVCGAPNLREGMITILALPDALIPESGVRLKPSTIRGEESFGMLCSSAELGAGSDSEGILDLDSTDLTLNPAVGLGLDDPVVTLETTPNRPDWAGVQGIARDLAASGCGQFIPAAPLKLVEDGTPTIKLIDEQSAETCLHFVGREVRGVKNKPSPARIANRLRAIGLRPISALVDITNYICFDRARPLHIYDADKISGDISLRQARAGEGFDALDGKHYTLDPTHCVIADSTQVLALGGVMGGAASSVSNETKNIFIESAWFEPTPTARTARSLGLHSDSSYRFERGVDPLSVESGCDLAASQVMDLCGGAVSQKVVLGSPSIQKNKIYFVPAQIEKLSGVKISTDKIKDFLDGLGFETSSTGDGFETTPPSWRFDFSSGTENNPAAVAELTEEIIRLYGVDRIAETPLSVPASPTSLPASALRLKRMRCAAAGAGLVEIISWSFQSPAIAALLSGGKDCNPALKLANPLSADLSVMRASLLGGLLEAVARNLSYDKQPLALFEAGLTFDQPSPVGQSTHLAAVRQGRQSHHWHSSRTADVWQIKSDMQAALAAAGLGVDKLTFASFEKGAAHLAAHPSFHPSKAAVVKLGTKVLGHFGELHPSVLEKLDITAPCVAFELNLDALPAPKAAKKTQRENWQPYTLMPVRRDFAFVLDQAVPAAELIQAASSPLKKIRHDTTLFDLFENEKALGVGKKSLTIQITLYPKEVLQEDAIDAYKKAIIQSVLEKTGGVLRG